MNDFPEKYLNKSVEVIKTGLLENVTLGMASSMLAEIKKDPEGWWAKHHFHLGTTIRNLLREKVCLDVLLPKKNWDYYYFVLFEIALKEVLKEIANELHKNPYLH